MRFFLFYSYRKKEQQTMFLAFWKDHTHNNNYNTENNINNNKDNN